MRRQTWAFVVAVAAAVIAITVALTGAFAWALAAAGIGAGAWSAARVWSRARPGPMPTSFVGFYFSPAASRRQLASRNIPLPRLGERILEVGPGVGIHALPVALALAPDEQPGVWLPEEVMSHERFFEALAPLGWKPVVEELPAKTEHSRPRRSIGRASGMSGASGRAAP